MIYGKWKIVTYMTILLLVGIAPMMIVDAYVPVTYTCCINYTSSDGTQLDNFENVITDTMPLDGKQLDNFENLSNWTVGGTVGASQEADIINVKEGQQGLKLIAKSGNVSYWNNTYSDKSINNNFSDTNNFGIWIYVDNVSTFYAGVLYFTSTTNWSKYLSKSFTIKTAGWNKLIFDKNSFTNSKGESWNNIMKKVRIAILPTNGQNTNATFDDFRYDVNTSSWIVGAGGLQEIDTVHFKDGNQGLKLLATNYTVATDKSINNNFSDTNNFVIWAFVDNASNSQYITLYLTSTTNYSKFLSDSEYSGVKTGWNKLVFNKHNFKNTGGESWNNVMKLMRLRIYSFPNTVVNVTFDDLRYDISGQRAKLMIQFDDGDLSTYTNAYPVLNNNSQPGVSNVITTYIGTDSWYMNLDNLRVLQNSGWDIASHTVDHLSLPSLNDTALTYELNNSYDWLVANKFQKSAGFIAYPYGTFNDAVIEKVKHRYILGRSTQPESAQQHFTQMDDSIQYIQRTVNIDNNTDIQTVEDKINDSINAKLLGILLFHDIVNVYPVCTVDQPCTYQYLTSDLKKISDYIKSRSADVDVITYSDYVIPNIRDFAPVVNKTTRIYSNGSSVLITKNKYDEYMPNMTVRPLSDSVDINITNYNETGGLVRFNESSSNTNLQVSYDIGDRVPNQIYNVKIYWTNGTKYQDFNVSSNINGHITYSSVGFMNPRYQVIDKTNVIYVPLSITSYIPTNDPNTTFGIPQTFQINLNKTVNVTWYINGSLIQPNSSVTRANYTNSSAGRGIYNVTAIADDGFNSVSRMWNWTVNPVVQARYNLSGNVLDNNGLALEGVSVQNDSYNNTTDISGYYLITGLLNGTYNFSYSKAGFNTGYLTVTINGTDNNSVNLKIYDNTPPMQVAGLVNDSSTQTAINLSWNVATDANYYQVFRDSVSIGYTKNDYWFDTGLTPDTLYQYSVRANDSYNNWGVNSSILDVRTDVQNYLLSIVSSLPVSDPSTMFGTSQTFELDLNKTADIVWYVNGSIVRTDLNVSAFYSNPAADIGIYNVTAIADDGFNSVSRMWNWTVNPVVQARYNLSGNVLDNNGLALEGVSVQNDSYNNTTDISGYYLITGLLNGTYNFSYSKAGFNTGYLTVTINGTDNNSVNIILNPVPVIKVRALSVVIFPTNTTANSVININVNISNNDGVVEVKADNTFLTNNNGIWTGSIVAPLSIGNYTLNITARDTTGDNYQISAPYKVLNRQGGASLSIIPRITNVTNGTTMTSIIKVKNTQNIDDKFRIYISEDGIPVASQSNLNWFSWTGMPLDIRAGQEISVPIDISPSTTGNKIFRAGLNSTTSTKVYTYDTGYLRIT